MKRFTVFTDGSENDKESLASAVAFCRLAGGRLDVVHATRRDSVIMVPPDAAAFVEIPEEEDDARTKAAKDAFDAVCGGLDFASWEVVAETPPDAIRDHGLLSDAVILERVSSEEGPDVLAMNTALFDTGTPVLVCPPKPPASIGDSVAVVWSPTVQSARAVRSSVPILQRAKSVTILTDEADRNADPQPLATYLDAHGIDAEAKRFYGGGLSARGRGRAIIAATADSADLLVMGAYGENMLSTLFGLGGATQKVIGATRIPALVQR